MAKETKKKTSTAKKAVVAPTISNTLKRRVNVVDEDFTDAFIREVDEDVKNDNLRIFWNKYGLYVILFVVFCLTLAVSFESLKAWKVRRDQAMTNAYISTLNMKNNGKLNESLVMLKKISEDGNGIYRDIAKLQTVNVLLEQGNKDQAVKELKEIVNNVKINESLRSASRLKLVSLQFDEMTSAQIEETLTPIAEDKNWAPYAKEFIAMAAIKDNDLEKAKSLYSEILAMPDLSENFRTRTMDILSVLNEK